MPYRECPTCGTTFYSAAARLRNGECSACFAQILEDSLLDEARDRHSDPRPGSETSAWRPRFTRLGPVRLIRP
jgi:hypothetical protein